MLSHISELLGGAERSMLDVFDILAKKYGIEPEFILREPVKSLAQALDKRGWKYHAFDYGFWSDASPPVNPEDIFRNAVRNSKAIKSIEEIIQNMQPDIVVTNSVVCPWAAIAAHFQQVPHVWFVREYGDLDHGRIFEIGREQALTDVGSLSRLVVANSKTLENHLSQYIDKDKLTTLYNPFNLDEIKNRAKQSVKNPYKSPNSLKLITTNNIAPTKGQLEVVEAVGKLTEAGEDVELCIMGAGNKEYIDILKDTARRYGIIGRIHLVGSQPDTVPYITLSDVGIMASRKEAFGRATFECLAAGRPVVGANSGATPEMITTGVNGYLYTQGDSDSLASELKHYLKDKSLLKLHSQAAGQTAEEMMKGVHNIDALYGQIHQVVKGKKGAKQQPIYYLQKWFDYVDIGQQAMDKAHTFTFRRILQVRLKRRLRTPYLRLRSLLSRVTGK